MFRMTFSVEGEVVVDRMLQGIADRMTDLSPAWPKVIETLQEIFARAFATEGGSTGSAWPQLAPRTQADRRRQGFAPAHPILQCTGKLSRALTTGEGAYFRTTPTIFEYLLSQQEVGYFPYHQSRAPRSRIPRRAPVQFTGDDQSAVVFPIRLYVTGRDINAPRRQRVG